MGRITAYKKRGEIIFRNELIPPETPDERVLKTLPRCENLGFLPVTREGRSGEIVLQVRTGEEWTLGSLLRQGTTKQFFLWALRQLVNMLETCEKNHFPEGNLMLSPDLILIDRSQQLHAVCWPVLNNRNPADIGGFFLNLPRMTAFQPGQDTEFLRDYQSFLTKPGGYSLADLKNLILHLENPATEETRLDPEMKPVEPAEPVEPVKRVNTGNTVSTATPAATRICPFCQAEIPENAIICLNCGRKQPERAPQEMETTVLTGSTTESVGAGAAFSLIRKQTGEEIRIDHSPFLLGKFPGEEGYQLLDNSAISRHHAQIVTRGGYAYIEDLGSTNGTFVNGGRIRPHELTEIRPEYRIRLADEDFVLIRETL